MTIAKKLKFGLVPCIYLKQAVKRHIKHTSNYFYHVFQSKTYPKYQKLKNSTVASGSSAFTIQYFDYPKCFINRTNEVYEFSIKYSDILLKKKLTKTSCITVSFAAFTLVIVLAWFL